VRRFLRAHTEGAVLAKKRQGVRRPCHGQIPRHPRSGDAR
jgi:hypothetical protein